MLPEEQYGHDLLRRMQKEQDDLAALREVIELLPALAEPFWHWGDGYGGSVRRMLDEAFRDHGLEYPEERNQAGTQRKAISPHLRKRIFERDAYRCRNCESYIDLHLDHILPVAMGGTDDYENLQTLCQKCNLSKGARYEG